MQAQISHVDLPAPGWLQRPNGLEMLPMVNNLAQSAYRNGWRADDARVFERWTEIKRLKDENDLKNKNVKPEVVYSLSTGPDARMAFQSSEHTKVLRSSEITPL